MIVAIAGGAWWLLFGASRMETNVTSSTSTSCLPAASLPKSMTIDYRNGQFFAEGATEASDTFCVPKGGTVTFTGSNLWVASDPHPTHTDLSAFDARAVKDAYSFTFDKVGEWGFHNHLRASDTGTIIVVE